MLSTTFYGTLLHFRILSLLHCTLDTLQPSAVPVEHFICHWTDYDLFI